MALSLLLNFCWLVSLALASPSELSVDPRGIVSIHRGVSSIPLDNGCEFAGTITLGGPSTLSYGANNFYNLGSKQLTAFQLMVDFINRHRCGVELESKRYALAMRTFDDQSDKGFTTKIAQHLTHNSSDVDLLLGGYSSGLTANMAAVANESGRLLLAPGAASTGVFRDRPQAFGTLPPTAKYTAQAVQALAEVAGAKSIATLYEDASFTRGACGAIPGLAEQYGLTVTSTHQVVAKPEMTDLLPIAQNFTDENPDVVMTCSYDKGCQSWMEAMQAAEWSPKAQIFTICVGLEAFADSVGANAGYIFGVTPWDQSLNIVDEVTGLSAREFAEMFKNATGDVDVTYHAASAASAISIAVQSIEQANTLDEGLLAEHIASSSFATAYGQISFDSNGQSQAPSLLIQYDGNNEVQTVFPPEISSGNIL